MKICVAQTNPISGAIEQNIQGHIQLIQLAISYGAGLIVFPELSLTGYEPTLANRLATTADDKRLDPFQELSDNHQVIVGAGLPTKAGTGVAISMVLFQPHQPRLVYSKKWIHADEEPYFASSSHFTGLLGGEARIALAICYELSVPEHAADAFRNDAKVYIASVSKTFGGIDKAFSRLSEIAQTYSMTVLLSNQVGLAEGQPCAGRSAIWNNKGELVEQLDRLREGVLLIDLGTQKVVKSYLQDE